ncbi:hypothetical protein JKG68_31795 [Microvirga aerilata]|uniref:Uncharacterized protein n=1 Tax=Microvirga aerilata TaxID=670292 RepID=A0A937D2R5_9HYPH|nr:hypothetical protein [Microvirga aerilata]MBL0408451.1 hypothetical protein [Microvirga aerilata]
MIKVKALRSFNATPQGGLVEVGDVLEVTEVRAGELVHLGLAQLVKAEKAAPAPQNKMAPEPENKGTAPETTAAAVTQAKRGTRKGK